MVEVRWRLRVVFDLLRRAVDARFNPATPDHPTGSGAWLASWGTAAGLGTLAFGLYKAVAIAEMASAGIFG